VEGRPLDQRADARQHLAGGRGHRGTEQPVGAGGRPDEAEQQPDRGGLAGAVRAQEAVDRAVGHGEVDGVDGDLAGAESLGQPGARYRERHL
jgi:hypothetical protein